MDLTTTKAAKLPPGEFKFITKAVEIEKAAPAEDGQIGPRRFKMIASSTVVDQSGDEIKMSALQDLAGSFQRGQNVFTDHDHKVRNVFGRTDFAHESRGRRRRRSERARRWPAAPPHGARHPGAFPRHAAPRDGASRRPAFRDRRDGARAR